MDNRIVKHGDREVEYQLSTSERLLEDMCKSFNTELGPAEVNAVSYPLFTRLSFPVAVSHLDGSERILRFQLTRFSPLWSRSALDVYDANTGGRVKKEEMDYAELEKEILKQNELWNAVENVTKRGYIDNLHVRRWQEEIYIAVYDSEKGKAPENPFLIHSTEDFRTMKLENLPIDHITFTIEPDFVLMRGGQYKSEETVDRISIRRPKEHEMLIRTLNPITQESNILFNFIVSPSTDFEFDSSVGRLRTMGFIQAYLNQICRGRIF